MICRLVFVLVFLSFLSSCVTVPDRGGDLYDLSSREYLYEKDVWFFSGRMSVVDKNHALSANVEWQHQQKKEKIKLSGPFGVGQTRIVLAENSVEIDSSGKRERYVGDVNDVVLVNLGINVPVSALRYWVLGVVDPGSVYREMVDGFEQHGWRVRYLKMQADGVYGLPKKIRIEQRDSRLKLIIDHWDI